MRAILYARVSTRDKGQDAENQIPEMRKCASDRRWNLRREFIDKASANGKVVREQFDAMMKACEHREADIILIWALDRLSREGPLKTMLLLDRLSRCGVKVKSMKEPWLDPESPLYELLVPIFAWIAKQERMRIGERVRAGLERAKEKGKRLGRPQHGADVEKIKKLRFRMKLSYRAIAKLVGISDASVRRVLGVRQKRSQKR